MASADFWSENLQECIQAAGQQQKTLLCFVTDDTEACAAYDNTIQSQEFRESLHASTVRLRVRKDTQAFTFLNGVCEIQHVPALVSINGGHIDKSEYPAVSDEQLKDKLAAVFSVESNTKTRSPAEAETTKQYLDLAPPAGRMRLPNNAYDALREFTEDLQRKKITPKITLQLQLRQLDNIPAMKSYVNAIKNRQAGSAPVLPEEAVERLLNTPATMLQARMTSTTSTQSVSAPAATAPARTSSPTSTSTPTSLPAPVTPNSSVNPAPPPQAQSSSTNQKSQRSDYIRQQRERETVQRTERDRIKAQIKSDREERQRLDDLRKQSDLAALRQQNSTTAAPSSTDIRIQVRTFDGSTLRTSFPCTATVTDDVRPWIDTTNQDANKIPYNLKIILAPLPNREIEATEEDRDLPELGIVGSATLIMVPVKGFVDSYTGATAGAGGFVRSLMASSGSVFHGLFGMFGLVGTPQTAEQGSTEDANTTANKDETDRGDTSGSSVKVRTLADQRADENRKRGTQLYNGNSQNIQGRKDDDDRKQD